MRLAAFRNGKIKSWITDRMMLVDPTFPRERFEITVPDAIWTTKESERRIAVEYERTRKGRSRVKAKVDAYERELVRPDRRIDLVLWVAAPGSYQDLKTVLVNHPSHQLRTLQQFIRELAVPYNPIKCGDATDIHSALMNAMTWSESFYRGVAEKNFGRFEKFFRPT